MGHLQVSGEPCLRPKKLFCLYPLEILYIFGDYYARDWCFCIIYFSSSTERSSEHLVEITWSHLYTVTLVFVLTL